MVTTDELEDALEQMTWERNAAIARAEKAERKSADLESCIHTLCLPPGISDTLRERCDYTLACLREAVSRAEKAEAERDRLREALEDITNLDRLTPTPAAMLLAAVHLAQEALDATS